MRASIQDLAPHLILLAAAIFSRPAACGAVCIRVDPTGYFEGTAESRKAGRLEIALNLRQEHGRYEGELITPLGNFRLTDGSFPSGELHLRFDVAGDPGTIVAHVDAGTLRGTLQVPDETVPVEMKRVGEPRPSLLGKPTLEITSEQWHEDLAVLARDLEKRHADAFHHTPRERFEAEVADVDRRLDHMNGDEAYVALDRLANLVGDAHTYVEFPDDVAALPLSFGRFGDEHRVIRAAPGCEKALGARLLAIQGTPVARVREILEAMTPRDELPGLVDARITAFLSKGICLHGFGIVPDRSHVRLALADDSGREFEIELSALAPGTSPRWIWPFAELPLFRRNPEQSLWSTYLEKPRTVYGCFRGYQDLEKRAGDLMERIRREHPDKVVIDMRQNGGGDYEQGLAHLIRPLAGLADINKRGHLFVLIGPATFSAAMSNAAQFRSQTAAILVGEAIGEKPNSYQEPRQSTLPNSHLTLRYSTRYYKFVEGDLNIVKPDREIVPSWAEFKSGRDPVLDWVLEQEDR